MSEINTGITELAKVDIRLIRDIIAEDMRFFTCVSRLSRCDRAQSRAGPRSLCL